MTVSAPASTIGSRRRRADRAVSRDRPVGESRSRRRPGPGPPVPKPSRPGASAVEAARPGWTGRMRPARCASSGTAPAPAMPDDRGRDASRPAPIDVAMGRAGRPAEARAPARYGPLASPRARSRVRAAGIGACGPDGHASALRAREAAPRRGRGARPPTVPPAASLAVMEDPPRPEGAADTRKSQHTGARQGGMSATEVRRESGQGPAAPREPKAEFGGAGSPGVRRLPPLRRPRGKRRSPPGRPPPGRRRERLGIPARARARRPRPALRQAGGHRFERRPGVRERGDPQAGLSRRLGGTRCHRGPAAGVRSRGRRTAASWPRPPSRGCQARHRSMPPAQKPPAPPVRPATCRVPAGGPRSRVHTVRSRGESRGRRRVGPPVAEEAARRRRRCLSNRAWRAVRRRDAIRRARARAERADHSSAGGAKPRCAVPLSPRGTVQNGPPRRISAGSAGSARGASARMRSAKASALSCGR